MMTSIDRRQFLAMTAVLAADWAMPSVAPTSDRTVSQLLDAMAGRILRLNPESATSLGIDHGTRAGLKFRLTDRSSAGVAMAAAAAGERLAQLRRIDARALSAPVRLNLHVALRVHELAVEGYAFGFGDTALFNQEYSYRNAPYVVAQNTGAFVEIPELLNAKHRIADARDAEAYLERLNDYAKALNGETERLAADRSRRIVAPSFLLDKTLTQMRKARSQPVSEWGIVTSLAMRTTTMRGDFAARAARIAAASVAPALDAQLAELDRHRAVATDEAGIWKLPQGEAYYQWALRSGTTTALSPDEVHALGHAQLDALNARMEPLLRELGLTQGSVGDRMKALGEDPRYSFPNTDAGRTQILDYLNGRVTDIRARMPRAFATAVPGRLIIQRVPPDIEAGAPDGYATAGSMDGSVPGHYYINLATTSVWPRFSLPTLTYHEGIPGHVWQGEFSYKLPLIRSLFAFNAYAEGWALYAEQLADELGVYEGDPVGRLGYLQSLSFRACRLVVDTGLHAKRWTRAKAIDWFANTNGGARAQIENEIDRYCAWPGQACGYAVGFAEINRLRDKARASLGPRFDLRRFDDAVVLAGNVPLTLLDEVIDEYIARL